MRGGGGVSPRCYRRLRKAPSSTDQLNRSMTFPDVMVGSFPASPRRGGARGPRSRGKGGAAGAGGTSRGPARPTRARVRPARRVPSVSAARGGGSLRGPAGADQRGRRALGGEGRAECTASGVPLEAFQPGDPAFPPISAPAPLSSGGSLRGSGAHREAARPLRRPGAARPGAGRRVPRNSPRRTSWRARPAPSPPRDPRDRLPRPLELDCGRWAASPNKNVWPNKNLWT